ncbi:MAG: right-handed parallel beta-helix repeat-containing protein [Tepidisphaeraceae bacterium]
MRQHIRVALTPGIAALAVWWPFVAQAALPTTMAAGVEIHVAPSGDDAGDGSPAHMLRTISAAAARARPGDTVTVHAGVYRERIDPPRGGESDARRIVYQAAPGDHVEISGAERVEHWTRVQGDTWRADVPNSVFGNFNPFGDVIRGDWFRPMGHTHHTGAVYLNGDWLAEAFTLDEVLSPAGSLPLWFAKVGAKDTTVWAQFKGVDPNTQMVEVNARRCVFYPSKTGVNYLTVRGFTLTKAATPWAPPTAEQVALIGTNWSRGWKIEHNRINYSICCGVSLGKYGDEFDNKSQNSAGGYVKTIDRALTHGWDGSNVGHHVVHDNVIDHCEQAGVVGSLGGIFSVIAGNDIHDIHVRHRFDGAEMAGIKLHAAIDTVIRDNHLYRCNRGIWLDWMAQGTLVSGNLLHDNATDKDLIVESVMGGRQDMFLEVNHGPTVLVNNVMLSSYALNVRSQGTAYVHNLFAGQFRIVPHDSRVTPFQRSHSTAVAGMHDNPAGDVRFYNNVFFGRPDLSGYDAATLPVTMAGNVFVGHAKPSKWEAGPVRLPDADSAVHVIEKGDGFYLDFTAEPTWRAPQPGPLVTSDLLGRTQISGVGFEQADGRPYRFDRDYFGHARNPAEPFPGPFELTSFGRQSIKVWPKNAK